MYIPTLLVLVLIQYTLGYNDENYPYLDTYESNMMYPEDYQDQENDLETIEKRSNSNFLRFGRGRSDDREPDPRPTRGAKMTRNDYFVRFGRSKQDYLRFGRDPAHQRYARSKGDYVRFGRSAPVPEHRLRAKREAVFEPDMKRNSNFLRFGRNSNFLRFGRNKEDSGFPGNQQMELTHEEIKVLNKLRQFYEVPLIRLFAQMESSGQEKCKNNV